MCFIKSSLPLCYPHCFFLAGSLQPTPSSSVSFSLLNSNQSPAETLTLSASIFLSGIRPLLKTRSKCSDTILTLTVPFLAQLKSHTKARGGTESLVNATESLQTAPSH